MTLVKIKQCELCGVEYDNEKDENNKSNFENILETGYCLNCQNWLEYPDEMIDNYQNN